MNTIVTVKEGALEGAFSDDKQSVIFKGVPYAAPPVGELRWKRPQPHAKWEGVRPALEFSAKAPQADLSKMGLYGKEFYSDENLKRSDYLTNYLIRRGSISYHRSFYHCTMRYCGLMRY